MYQRTLKERKEVDGNNIEFKVERNVVNEKFIIESEETIIKNIESGDFDYYVGKSTLVEVVDSDPKYIRSSLNESTSDNINDLPTYE